MNVEILMYLLKGFKIKELTTAVGISTCTLQKRIKKIQIEFNFAKAFVLIRIM